MIRTPRFVTALALGAALTATASKAQADEDFLWGLGIGLGVGVIGTSIVHDHHHHHAHCGHYYPAPVVYRTYEPEVRYVEVERPVYPEGSYVEYSETKVWPFYKKVDMEIIPALPAQPQGRPQAVRLQSNASAARTVDSTDQYQDEAAPEAETLREKVEDVKSQGTPTGRVTQVSNRAGRVVTLPAREADAAAPAVRMVENASTAKGTAKIEI